MTILVIVESPGKITKISSILGNNYRVKATKGIFRDLDPKSMSIDFENHFEPIYVITKPEVVSDLKDDVKKADLVYVATDADREGSQIAKSIVEVFKPKKYKRMLFDSITRTAILDAIKNAGEIDENLVQAQKARRVLDRLYGYLISPVLSKHLGGALSAGRVQSVALELVVNKEKEIQDFIEKNKDSTFFKVTGIFSSLRAHLMEKENKKEPNQSYRGKVAHLPLVEAPHSHAKVIVFLKRCLKSQFLVHSVEEKMTYRSPAPPFTTSTLQQEAVRKLGMSIDVTMKVAQKLYEAGYITYMRTDSVAISAEGQEEIRKVIEREYGKEYYQKNVFKTKVANAQEAHESCRPTHPELMSLEKELSDPLQVKLYKLIWQRTIASQMKKAQIKVTVIQIDISKYVIEKIEPFYYFQSEIEKVIFPGFMKVYVESTDNGDENFTKNYTGKIPKPGEKLLMEQIVAQQEFLRPPPRYTQASLVKKLEELGIGRPATYVSIIKTIMDRDYIRIGDVPGIEKITTSYTIKSDNSKHVMSIFEESGTVFLGLEKNKIIPTNLGKTVTEFLLENFPEMMDYQFTARIEQELDDISNGKKVWYQVVQKFYDKLLPIVEDLATKKSVLKASEKLLGKDKEGNEIFVVKTKYGPRLKKKVNKKFIYTKIEEPYTLETITLKEAIKLFEYPKLLGEYLGKEVYLSKGPYGFYLVHDKDFYSLPEELNREVNLNEAIQVIESKKQNVLGEYQLKEGTKTVKIIALKGQYGPYLQVMRGRKKKNYPIPKDLDPAKLTEEQIKQIIYKKKTFANKGGSKVSRKLRHLKKK